MSKDLTMLFRSLFEIFTSIKNHNSQYSNNNDFADNCKKNRVNIHSTYFLFSHQIKNIKNMVTTTFNSITKGLYCSIGRKIDAQNTPKVTWAKATKIWVKASLHFSVNFIPSFILSQQTNLKINGQIDPSAEFILSEPVLSVVEVVEGLRTSDAKRFNYALTATQVKTLYNSGAARFGPSTGAP